MNEVLINGILLNSDGDMVVRASSGGQFEPQTFAYLDTVFPSGGLMIDVGAYSGVYSIYCAKKHSAVCYAFEPNPLMYGRLNENITLNNAQRHIHAMNFGLSNERAKLPFYTSPSTLLTSAGSFQPSRRKPRKQQLEVEVYDDLPLSVLSVDLIKIDVEGYELKVISGMVETIKRDRPIMIVECLGEKELNECDQLLIEQLGYERVACLDERNYAYEHRGNN